MSAFAHEAPSRDPGLQVRGDAHGEEWRCGLSVGVPYPHLNGQQRECSVVYPPTSTPASTAGDPSDFVNSGTDEPALPSLMDQPQSEMAAPNSRFGTLSC
jgi:hypothetical protein